ncbi:hypothetical protein C8R48DRAFT_772447 [Suillus tomentosus]|nr:hypothetical protein C8R48DRAFT_772447 [Suillus tomentosus]
MSASELANTALIAAMEDIQHLMVKSMKLQVGHLNAMVFAHEITKIIAHSLWKHGDPVTRKIITLPDWSAVNMDNPCIAGHPRFHKTIGYQCPDHITPAPIIPAPQPLVIADKPSTVVASLEVLDSAELPLLKFNLFVASTKRKANRTDSNIWEETWVTEPKRKVLKTNPAPQQKTATSSKRRRIVRSKRFVSHDEDESADGAVIIIIKKPETGALAEHVVPVQPASKGSMLSNLTDVEELEERRPSCADSPVIRIREVHKSCPACKDKKVKCIRLIPEAEDVLRDIVAKKKAATASKATAKEKKPHGHKQAKLAAPLTSRVCSQCLRPTPAEEVPNNDAPTVANAEHPLIDFDAEDSADDASDKDIQFAGNFGSKAPVPPVIANVKDAVAPITVQVDAPPPAVHAPPVILPQVTARDLLLGIKALGRRMDDLQVSHTQAQAWHAQMGEQVTALEQDWEKKFNFLKARVSNLELKTLNNVMVSGNLASLISSIYPANNPNTSFAPPPVAGTSTSPYGALQCLQRSLPQMSNLCLMLVGETSDLAGPSESPDAASVSKSANK